MNNLVQSIIHANCATITCIQLSETLLLQRFLEEQDYYVITVDIGGLNAETEIFSKIVESLPNGSAYTEMHPGVNLAAFDDFLIEVLMKNKKVAFLICNSEKFNRFTSQLGF